MPTSQGGQTHSNISSAFADELFECFWLFCGVGIERVKVTEKWAETPLLWHTVYYHWTSLASKANKKRLFEVSLRQLASWSSANIFFIENMKLKKAWLSDRGTLLCSVIFALLTLLIFNLNYKHYSNRKCLSWRVDVMRLDFKWRLPLIN